MNYKTDDRELSPKEIVKELDRFVVGQKAAKEYVAHALRYRWRRMQLSEPLCSEIQPKNILMIGPTGVGKTEIARRLSKIGSAPFIKVEATKFTEVGYMGRDVEQIIRDLLDIAIAKIKSEIRKSFQEATMSAAEEKVIDLVVGANASQETREKYLQELRDGLLNDRHVEVQITQPLEIQGANVPDILGKMMGKKYTKRMPVQDALSLFHTEAIEDELDNEEVIQEAIEDVEQRGIVFIDEIDKICADNRRQQDSVSREGVQRDLLPLIEGTEVSTKHGFVKTNHILFITSGAFQISKKEDLIPELQGRLPIIIHMDPLTQQDFVDILSKTESSLMVQYTALMATEGISVEFTQDGLETIALIAVEMNQVIEDIGARRLHGLMETLMHNIGFDIEQSAEAIIRIDDEFVRKQLGNYQSSQTLDVIL